MRITPKDTEKSEKYPLSAKDLKYGQFAEHENGTIVIRLHRGNEIDASDHLINIENGVGSYSPTSKFRLLPDHLIEFSTGADSKAQYRGQ
jgi:hypothetical protein